MNKLVKQALKEFEKTVNQSARWSARWSAVSPNNVVDVVSVNALQPLGREAHRYDVWIYVCWLS